MDQAHKDMVSVMTARQQLARLLPLVLLILLAIAGLHGAVASPRWDGPLRSDGVTIGLILEAILGVLLALTLRRDRAAKRAASHTASKSANSDEARTDVPAALRFVLTWVLSLGMIAVAIALIADLHLHFTAGGKPSSPPRPPVPGRLKPAPTVTASSSFHFPWGPVLWGLLAAVLVAAIVISIWWSTRVRRPATPQPMTDDLAEDSEGLRDAVASGRAALAELDDAREAIIACYVAMESTLADRGTARQTSDTPDELLARAVTTGILDGMAAGAAEELTNLFYEARFSTHPLGESHRDAARHALDYLAEELAEEPQTQAPQ